MTNITLDEFFKMNPPCKQCIVRSVCINYITNVFLVLNNDKYIYIDACEEFKDFIQKDVRFLQEISKLGGSMGIFHKVIVLVILLIIFGVSTASGFLIQKKPFETTVFIDEFYSNTLSTFIKNTYHLKNRDVLRIISYGNGGDAFICIAMINHIEMLKRRGVKIITKVQSKALSANAFLWLTGDERIVHQHDLIMTHYAPIKDRFGNKVLIESLPQEDQMIINLLKVYIKNKLLEILKDAKVVNEMLDDENNWYTGFELFQLRVATTLIYN